MFEFSRNQNNQDQLVGSQDSQEAPDSITQLYSTQLRGETENMGVTEKNSRTNLILNKNSYLFSYNGYAFKQCICNMVGEIHEVMDFHKKKKRIGEKMNLKVLKIYEKYQKFIVRQPPKQKQNHPQSRESVSLSPQAVQTFEILKELEIQLRYLKQTLIQCKKQYDENKDTKLLKNLKKQIKQLENQIQNTIKSQESILQKYKMLRPKIRVYRKQLDQFKQKYGHNRNNREPELVYSPTRPLKNLSVNNQDTFSKVDFLPKIGSWQIKRPHESFEVYKRRQSQQNVSALPKNDSLCLSSDIDSLPVLKANYSHENGGNYTTAYSKDMEILINSKQKKSSNQVHDSPIPELNDPQIRELILFYSPHLKLFVYLPSILKITIIKINNIDRENQIADVSLKLELKVKIATQNPQFRNTMKFLNMNVKTEGIEQVEDNQCTFCHLTQFNTNQPNSIWTNPCAYFKSQQQWSKIDEREAQMLFNKTQYFSGLIYSAKMPSIKLKIRTYDFHSPFEILDFNGFVQIASIETLITNWGKQLTDYFVNKLSISPKIVIRFNLISLQDSYEHFTHQVNVKPGIELDGYNLAETLINYEVSHQDKSSVKLKYGLTGWKWHNLNKQKSYQKQNQQKSGKEKMKHPYENDNYAHFHFPFYRNPVKPLVTIFIPNIVLGIINFFIFFQEDDLADRIANIATLLISFVGMIAIIQSEIKRSVLSVTSILVYLMILTPLLCLTESMHINITGIPPQPLKSPFFWVCVIITVLNLLYPLFMLIFFKFCQEPHFNVKQIAEKSIILPGQEQLSKNKDNFIKISQQNLPLLGVTGASNTLTIDRYLKQLTQKRLLQVIAGCKRETTKYKNMRVEVQRYFSEKDIRQYLPIQYTEYFRKSDNKPKN